MSTDKLNTPQLVEFNRKKLTDVFSDISEQSMRDMPVFNKSIKTYAEGFEVYNGFHLGVLLTPWFLNVMAFPATDDKKQQLARLSVGGKTSLALPGGLFEFIKGFNEQLGDYLSCSLMSPVFELSDQQTATETAHLALNEILTAQETTQYANENTTSSSNSKLAKSVSRRDFITGFNSLSKGKATNNAVSRGTKL